jgi:hypothetical protein
MLRCWHFAAALFALACGETGDPRAAAADSGADAGGADAGGADGAGPGDAAADDHVFTRIVLHTEFYSEGAHAADVDKDGKTDVIAGPYWYAGPDFKTRHEIYAPTAFDPKGYSDNFFAFPCDFNQDSWVDVLVIGFPGQGARWYENPQGSAASWARHDVFSVVDTESPTFLDLTGDGKPELVCATAGRLGYATPDWSAPEKPWTFHSISPPGPYQAFTHGLGVGDVDGDGRLDVLEATGAFLQPANLSGDPDWARVAQTFGGGGAQMFAADLDGDSDRDVVASLAAHGYGVAWFEKGATGYTQHLVSGEDAAQTPTGVVLHEPHALALADMDGDTLPDLVTGERFWGHVPAGNPSFTDPAKLYWFRLVRDQTGVRLEPQLIDDASGVGTQVEIVDLDGNGLGDVVVASKKGAFVFLHFVQPAAG